MNKCFYILKQNKGKVNASEKDIFYNDDSQVNTL